jgi:hypothetical protein
MRLAIVLALALAATAAGGADERLEVGKPLPCDGMWLFKLSRQQLPGVGQLYHFSSKGKEADERFAQDIKSGKTKALLDTMAMTLKWGAEKPSNVTLAGAPVIIEAMLSELAPRLEGARLPYLNFLFVGPKELEPKARALISEHDGVYKYVEYSQPKCEADK